MKKISDGWHHKSTVHLRGDNNGQLSIIRDDWYLSVSDKTVILTLYFMSHALCCCRVPEGLIWYHNNCVTRLVRYQISTLSNITRFKVWVKARDNMVIFSHAVYLLRLCIHACTRMCRQTLAHTSVESVSELSIIASGSPVLFGWLQVDGWVSLEQLC